MAKPKRMMKKKNRTRRGSKIAKSTYHTVTKRKPRKAKR